MRGLEQQLAELASDTGDETLVVLLFLRESAAAEAGDALSRRAKRVISKAAKGLAPAPELLERVRDVAGLLLA